MILIRRLVKLEQLEEVRIADLCFSSSVVAAIAEDPIDHDDNSDDDATGKKYIGKKSKPLDNSYHLINFSPWSFLSLDNFFPLITFITWSFLSLDNFYHLITFITW